MQNSFTYIRLISKSEKIICAKYFTNHHNILGNRTTPTSKHHHQQYRHVSQSVYSTYFSIDVLPIKCAYSVLDGVHTLTGMPWWATILTTTFFLRTVITLPIYIFATKNTIKLEILRPQIVKMSDDLKKEIARAQKEFKWTQKTAYGQYKINMNRLVRETYIKYNCHPGKNMILPWMQIPIWVSMSMALRNMSGSLGHNMPVLCPELSIEGTLWFGDLLIPDIPLSLIFFLTNFIIIELHNKRMVKKTRAMKVLTNFSRVFNVIMLPIAMSMPCSLSFYWTCSSLYGLLQNIVIANPVYQKALIPKIISSINRGKSIKDLEKKTK